MVICMKSYPFATANFVISETFSPPTEFSQKKYMLSVFIGKMIGGVNEATVVDDGQNPKFVWAPLTSHA